MADYYTLGLDADGYLAVDKYGDLAILKGSNALAADTAVAASTWAGEVYTNGAAGVPYESFLGQPLDKNTLTRAIAREVLRLPGVVGAEVTLQPLAVDRVLRGTIYASTVIENAVVNIDL